MKKTNQGFVLLETLIVSTFIIGVLVYLYVQFTNIKKNYDFSFRYDTIPGLYQAQDVSRYLTKINESSIATAILKDGYIAIEDCAFVSSYRNYCDAFMQFVGAKKIIVVPDDLTNFKQQLKNNNPFDEEMYQYIMKLDTYGTSRNRVILEFDDRTFASTLIK